MGSTTLNRSLLVDTAFMGVVTDALGTSSGDFSSDFDIGKGVKMGAASYVVVAKANEIEGIVTSVEPGTRNGGFNWGGVQTKGRAEATVGASQTGNIAVGALVVNDTPVANGTAGKITVFGAGTGYVAPTKFLWRVIRVISGTGATNSTVLIERL